MGITTTVEQRQSCRQSNSNSTTRTFYSIQRKYSFLFEIRPWNANSDTLKTACLTAVIFYDQEGWGMKDKWELCIFRDGLNVAVSHTYHWVLHVAQVGLKRVFVTFLTVVTRYLVGATPGQGVTLLTVWESTNPSWLGSTAEFMGVESGAESSLGFAILLNTISRWYGSQMRPSIPFILAFEPYMCPLDTMHQRFQIPLTVLPAGDQLKHTSLWGHFMSKPLQYPRLALSF